MKKVIIVQARMTSTRLPGKILKQVMDKPLLEYQIERLRDVLLADEIVVATTTNQADEPIIELCSRLAVSYFRGSEEDVLSRYYHAASQYKADIVIRITSDCPVIDPKVIDRIIRFYTDHAFDYVSNSLNRTYPRGMDTEAFSYKVLQEAFEEATEQPEREHVTPFLYRHPERYRLANVSYVTDFSKYRWTVDTPEDYTLIKRIITALYPLNAKFCLEDILRLLEQNPNWHLINAHIEQKKYGQ